ncbi:alpha-galactosidase [Glaciihabitans arcticus]|uniref:Alpha-galactosidase n=1 Tax=Glaciihabitans arcticus TaxID=2668039 RepID=A0A4Q9GVC3_9MICO|nr:glycoside hydrolase family 36 protein [Glaciihabitans arcticus]TBN56583.1 alpha-galactosidase [Glaciihabitans arcticus]
MLEDLIDSNAIVPVDGGWIAPAGPVEIKHPGALTFYRHGWNSWSPTGWSPLAESPMRIYGDPGRTLTADDAAHDDPTRHEGSAVGALDLADGRVLLLGALGLGSPRVGASVDTLWGYSEEPVEWFVGLGDEVTVFARYAELLTDRLGTPLARPIETLWCSWYSFFEDIDETTLRDTIDELGSLPLDVIQIDDGWETVVGDWTPNERFPTGMSGLADQIRDRGSLPGLWLAPLIALPGSTLATEHPDWLVHNESGQPLVAGFNWESHYFALDTTHPEVQQHLRAVFAEVTGWGFQYLKLDFLYAGALVGVRHENIPRERVYREALELIREVVGPDVYLLGCGAPLIPSIGVLDGARVGPDTGSDWAKPATISDPSHEGGLNGFAASVERLWMRDLFQVDPDVAFFRSTGTTLTEPQKQVIVDAARVAGFRSTSDPLAWLSDSERAELGEFFETSPGVTRLARYRYSVDGREVDFGPAIAESRSGRESLSESVARRAGRTGTAGPRSGS